MKKKRSKESVATTVLHGRIDCLVSLGNLACPEMMDHGTRSKKV